MERKFHQAGYKVHRHAQGIYSVEMQGVFHYINRVTRGSQNFYTMVGHPYYRKIGETEWTETNNMWHQGEIPKRLNIADTHEFKPYERKEVSNGGDCPFTEG